jgi:DNA-directed RNA polymerase subunit omega
LFLRLLTPPTNRVDFLVDKPFLIFSCHRSPAIQSPDAGMNSQLLDEASKVIHEPQVLINMVSKRVRQLSAGSRAMVSVEGRMGLADIALAEIAQGKLILAQAQNGQKPEE